MNPIRSSARVVICAFALVACDSTTPLVATHVAFEGQPSATVVSAQPLGDIRVNVLTEDGRVATGTDYHVTISLSASDPTAQLAGTTNVGTTNGVATFSDLTVARAGTDFRLVASVTGLGSGTSQSFAVTPGPAGKLSFDSFVPPSALVASAIPAVVHVTDAAGNTVTGATNSVTLGYTRVSSYGMTTAPDGLFGPTTVAAVNGVAMFSGLSFHKSGFYTLAATAPGLTGATSEQIAIQAAYMTKLIFVTQPQDGTASAALPSFSVQQVDDYGNGLSLPPGPTYSATLALGNNPSGAALGGTVTAQSFGVAALNFGDVSIDKPGTGYTIVATSAGRTITSAPFDIH